MVLTLACGAEQSDPSEAHPLERSSSNAQELSTQEIAPTSNEAASPGDPTRCERDEQCVQDDLCIPTQCIFEPFEVLYGAVECEESGPPIGTCVCVEGECQEVPL